jgi:hypothetical protein
MSDNMSNSILKNLCKIVLNFELSRRHPRRGRQPYHVSYDAPLENPSHIIFGCAFAHGFRTLSTPAMVSSPRSPTWSPCALPPSATLNTALTLRLPFLWHLWKHINNIVFNELAPLLSYSVRMTSFSGAHVCQWITSTLIFGSPTLSPSNCVIV